MTKVFMYRDSYDSYYQYRKAIRRRKSMGWIVRNVSGGVVCFQSIRDYEIWKNQK